MFTPERMSLIHLFVREEDVERVTEAVARLKCLDLSESKETEWTQSGTDKWRDLGGTYSSQEKRTKELMRALEIENQAEEVEPDVEPEEDYDQIERELKEIEKEVREWETNREEANRRITRLDFLLEEMMLLEPLEFTIEDTLHRSYIHLEVGAIPIENLQNLEVILRRIPFVIIPFHRSEDRVVVFAASRKEHVPILERTLRSLFFDPVELPEDAQGSPDKIIESLRSHRTKQKSRLSELKQSRRKLVEKYERQLKALWQKASANRIITEAIGRFGRHEQVYLLSAWVADSRLDEVIDTVEDASQGRADVEVLRAAPGEESRAPTLLSNPRFLEPFEGLVDVFGSPSYRELDPTPLVGITFLAMYGMMFGDIGHGLLLGAAGLLLRLKWGMKTLGSLIVASAGSAVIFGGLYGSLFGREDLLPHIWLSPMGSIENILIASVLAGVGLINLGFLLNLLAAMRSRQWSSFLFDREGIAGIVFYWALVGGITLYWIGQGLPFSIWAALLIIPASVLFLRSPLKNWISGKRPLLAEEWSDYGIQAFFELFETIISDLSNSLSFIRLGAFAVAHVGLSQIIFLLAEQVGGGLLWWLVAGLGTVIIVLFEGLIVGIQALRLEYYEFFSKFFEGKGRSFAPFSLTGMK